MKRIAKWFTQRWVLSLIGIILLSLVIWFIGPLIAIAGFAPLESNIVRLAAILLIFLIWCLLNFRVQYREKKAEEEIAEALCEDGGVDESAVGKEEVALLRQRMREAMRVLRKAELGGRKGRRRLASLPWYLLIGPPGAGKTTALVNSDLNFPLSDTIGRQALQGFGGTRNCDWWFTDEGVLLDTAGRYTTQDSDHKADAAAWQGFLALLRRYRRKAPINGVIVAVSATDLMLPELTAQYAPLIRQRLQELYSELKSDIPIYFLVTKTDLISGFTQYFDDLGKDARHQVWGFTYPLSVSQDVDEAVKQFSDEFDKLLGRLDERRLERLHQEKDLLTRGKIFAFPEQIGLLKTPLQNFLKEVFASSRFDAAVALRGIYLSSGTQEGAPIDRLIAAVAGSLGIARSGEAVAGGSGRSYFVTHLFRDVIFEEADAVMRGNWWKRKRTWVVRGSLALSVLAIIVAALAIYGSYVNSLHRIAEVKAEGDGYQAVVSTFPDKNASIFQVLLGLDKLKALQANAEKPSASWILDLGLDQGNKLGAAARKAYRKALHHALLPRVAYRLEDRLRSGPRDAELLYETLKVYLMLHDTKRFKRQDVQFFLEADGQEWLPGSEAEKAGASYKTHLDALLVTSVAPPPKDEDLVAGIRHGLADRPIAMRAYQRLKEVYLSNPALAEWRIDTVLGPRAGEVFVRRSGRPLREGISGFFTKNGYRKIYPAEVLSFVNALHSESWVAGGETESRAEALAVTQRDVLALYFEEYGEQWRALIRDLEIVPFRGLRHAVAVLDQLSGPNSMLQKLFVAVVEETSLAKKAPLKTDAIVQASSGLGYWRRRLATIMRFASEEDLKAITQDPAQIVYRQFSSIRALTKGQGDAPGELDRLLPLLQDLRAHFNSIALSPDPGAAARRAAQDPASPGRTAISKLSLEGPRQPEPLNLWIAQLIRVGGNLSLDAAVSNLNGLWQAEVGNYCRQALKGRYPFTPGSKQDVNLNDFARLFAPGGMLEVFFNKHLLPFVNTSSRPWRWARLSGSNLQLSPATLEQFQRSEDIRKAFFLSAARVPSVLFDIKPLSLHPDIGQARLEVAGQVVNYGHGPTLYSRLEWPGPNAANGARVAFTPLTGARSATLSATGPWGWFRLLEGAQRQQIGSDVMEVRFVAQDYDASYEIRANSFLNPFDLSLIRGFNCPGRL